MGVHDVAVVEPVDVVRAHHQHEVGIRPAEVVAQPEELVGVAVGEALLVHRAGALLRDQEAQPATRAVEVPRPAVAHLVLEGRGLVLHREPDVVDPRVDEVGQREVEQLVAAGERQCRLRPLQGEHVHPPTRATGLDDREDRRGLHCCDVPTRGGPTHERRRFLALRGAVPARRESRVRLLAVASEAEAFDQTAIPGPALRPDVAWVRRPSARRAREPRRWWWRIGGDFTGSATGQAQARAGEPWRPRRTPSSRSRRSACPAT